MRSPRAGAYGRVPRRRNDFSAMTPPSAALNPAAAAPVATAKNYLITQLDQVPAVPCPCGHSRRGFATPDNKLATIHLVDISIDAKMHYHKRMTEIYLVLEGEGFMGKLLNFRDNPKQNN